MCNKKDEDLNWFGLMFIIFFVNIGAITTVNFISDVIQTK